MHQYICANINNNKRKGQNIKILQLQIQSSNKRNMESEQEYMSQRAYNISSDMSFLKELAQPTIQTGLYKTARLNNVGSLAQLLKIKNARFSFSQQTRQNGQEWVRKKGGDLNPLITRIKQIKKQVNMKDQQMKAQSQCHFFMPKLTYENQDQYLNKNFEFGVVATVQNIMSEQKSRGSLAKRILNRRNISRSNNEKCVSDGLPVINLQIRNMHKKLSYLKQTKQIFTAIENLTGSQWALKYSAATKKQFWEIFANQLSVIVEQKNRNNRVSTLALASLQMVENQMYSQLPPNYDNVLYYLTNQYLGKMRGQYDSDGNLGPIWGICYMLYRAGRREQLYKIIPDQQLKKYFEQADTSIKQKKPIKIAALEESGDLFYNQLIYALKGVAKCSTQALCDPNNLDIVWVFLRNVGIFSSSPQDQSTFLGLRKQLYQSYKGPIISDKKIKNLLYLFGYGQIAEIGINQVMDQDDYLHFLIALYHSPAFELLSRQKKQFVQKKLTQELVHYVQQLLLEHKDDYLNYMLLIPKSKQTQQISSIIASSHLLQSIDWSYLKSKMNSSNFQGLVHASLRKYVAFHQDFIQVAKKECQLLSNQKAALQFILQFFIRSVLSSKVNAEQLKRAQIFSDDILARDINLRMEYEPVFNFFKQYRQLVSLIKERNEHKIFAFLRQSNFILISDQLRAQTRLCLNKLIESRGFQCYIIYLQNLSKAEELSLVRLQREADLVQLNSLTFNALVGIMKTQPYSEFANSQKVKNLMLYLRQDRKFDYI